MTEVLPTWRCGRVIADGGVSDVGCAAPAAQVGHVACVKQCNVAIEANRKDVRLTEGGERVSGKFEAYTPHTKFCYEKSPLSARVLLDQSEKKPVKCFTMSATLE